MYRQFMMHGQKNIKSLAAVYKQVTWNMEEYFKLYL